MKKLKLGSIVVVTSKATTWYNHVCMVTKITNSSFILYNSVLKKSWILPRTPGEYRLTRIEIICE